MPALSQAGARAPRELVALLGNRAGRAVLDEARHFKVRVMDILDHRTNGGKTLWRRQGRSRRPSWSRT